MWEPARTPGFTFLVPLEPVSDSSLVRTDFCSLNSPPSQKKKKNENYFRWFIAVLENGLHKLRLFQLQVTQIGLNRKENDSLIELNHLQGYWF